MPPFITSFDTSLHHINLEFFITDKTGIRHSVAGILDTGAPRTEFSDRFLAHTGMLPDIASPGKADKGLQTAKYGKMIIPEAEICHHFMNNFEIIVSYFEESWGVDALIGLDFFRENVVTVNYEKGIIISEPFGSR